MSTTKISSKPVDVYECDRCGDVFRHGTGDGGSFCSFSCHDDHRRAEVAVNIFKEIREDHRFCSTCYRMISEIERPPEKWGLPGCVIGYQYGTKHARTVWKDSGGRTRTGIGCECGNCQHYHGDETIRRRHLVTATHHFLDAVELLRIEGKMDHEVNRSQLFNAVIDIGDLQRAVEIAVQRS